MGVFNFFYKGLFSEFLQTKSRGLFYLLKSTYNSLRGVEFVLKGQMRYKIVFIPAKTNILVKVFAIF